MQVRGEALELALRIVLSCPCPVTSDEERQVFEYLRGLAPDEVADYAPVLGIFTATDTPFHGLADFTGWMAEAGAEATIERHHVLRCNGSSYHWQLAAESLPTHSRHVSSVSRWLLSHTVIPVRLTTADDGTPRAEYRYEGGSATLDHIFLPPEFVPDASPLWALHLGAVVSPLSAHEAALVSQLNEANPQLVLHRDRVARIDYADFEVLGDYRTFCRARHAPFWGDGAGSVSPTRRPR
jgi:hypothetical protein